MWKFDEICVEQNQQILNFFEIVEFGAFVNILPGKDGLLHISEIAEERTEDVNAVLKEGQEVEVKLIGFDRGKMKLSMKALLNKE